jgi:integrase
VNPRIGCAIRHKDSWYALVTVTDPLTKKRRYIKRKAKPDTKSAALELARQLARSIDRDAARPYGSPATLHQLLDHFAEHYVFPAEYVDERKISGYRSHASITGYLDAIKATMRDVSLGALTYGMLRNLKLALLKQETTGSKVRREKRKADPVTRSLANVHRILATVRHALRIAERESWISRNPFEQGPPLINPKDEKGRQRICSRAEEAALLRACERCADPDCKPCGGDASEGPCRDAGERLHLRVVLICAFDTGMRRGEILSLDWNDVDLKHSVIRVRAFNTKTMTGREVPITSRLAFELRRTAKSLGTTGRVFSIAGVRRSFSTAKRLAKVEGLRFHDIRHTAATRMVEGGMSLAEVGRILGHSEPRTTYRYTNANAATLERAAAIMEAYQASGSS